ncbi:MAG: tyrosine-type recombinase/integrase [Pseudomonadales bacterium]|nr:tyrosine-type recombinase/integrase [Pseudomonadales bacterium]
MPEAWKTWYSMLKIPAATVVTFSEAADRYCVEVLPTKAPNTQVSYGLSIARLRIAFGDMRLTSIEPLHVYKYMDIMPSPKQANRDKAVLSAILSQCVRWGAIRVNQILGQVKRNPEVPRDRYVTDEELAAFMDCCTEFMKTYVQLKMLTGLRQRVLLDLKRSDWDGKILSTPKHKGGKAVNYHGEGLAEAIQEAIQVRKGRALRGMYIFSTRNGTPYTTSGFAKLWQYAMAKHLKNGGAHFTEHDLRAKVSSDSKSDEEASNRLGHRQVSTTRRIYRRKPTNVSVLKPNKKEKR